MNITILGAGAFGTALGNILQANGHTITYYDHKFTLTLDEATKNADVIVLAIPSAFIDEPLKNLRTDLPLIVATKGLLSLEPFTKFHQVMFLSGGAFAADLNNCLKTTLTASHPLIQDLFTTDWLDFEVTNDAKGMILCGSLKNIYAIEAGFRDVEKNPKLRAEMIHAVVAEMKQILAANGAEPVTVDLACGIGDLKVTFTSSSRNYRFGLALKNNPSSQPIETTEGLTALSHLQTAHIQIPENATIIQSIINKGLTCR